MASLGKVRVKIEINLYGRTFRRPTSSSHVDLINLFIECDIHQC